MKKNYVQPTTTVFEVQVESQLLSGSGSEVTSVSTNLDVNISYGGGSNQAARVKSNAVDWDDWE